MPERDKMKCLITGGAGFIGSSVVDRLLEMDYEVICLDNFDPYYDSKIKRANIAHNLSNKNFTLMEGDIRDEELLKKIIRDIDCVFHSAAQAGVKASVRDPKKTHDINTGGTLNLLKASLNSDVKRIINSSSSSVYGKIKYLPLDEEHPNMPISPYGASKLAAEHYCRIFSELYGLKTVSLRFFTVYGPRMRPDLAISAFADRALKDEPIEIFGDGTKTRDFTFIDDAVEGVVLAMEKGKKGAYNIGGGSRISIQELAEKIIAITKSKSRIIHSAAVKGDAEHTWADITKAKKELGWEPKTSIEKGLRGFIGRVKK